MSDLYGSICNEHFQTLPDDDCPYCRIRELENRQSAFNDLVEANAGLSKELDELEAKLERLIEDYKLDTLIPYRVVTELEAALSGKLQPKQGEDA